MRIRTIKPEYFVHEGLFDLEKETGLPIRVAFAGLWCAADRRGRFKDEPRRLKAQILPYDDIDFSRILEALALGGFLVRYACPTRESRVDHASTTRVFWVIPSFEKHQVINNRERESDLPNPAECQALDACPTRAPRVPHACRKERKGKEPNKAFNFEGTDSNTVPGKTNSQSSKLKAKEVEKELMDDCMKLMGEEMMSTYGGSWRNRARENPDKLQRVLAELARAKKEGAVMLNAAAYANDLWMRWK